jgi:hypothetical protein
MDELTAFAKLHEHDVLYDFKDAWKIWMSQNAAFITEETDRLISAGFTGDVVDKMYKSVRYYFRKKSLAPAVQPLRNSYITLPHPLIEAIDAQIHAQIQATMYSISPANGFDLFCRENQVIIVPAMQTFYNQTKPMDNHPTPIPALNIITRDHVNNFLLKLKKTYKNRFYIIRTQYLSKLV